MEVPYKSAVFFRSNSTHTAFFTIPGQFALKIQNNNWTKIEQLCEYDMWHLIDQKLSASIFIQYYLFIYLKIILRFCIIWYYYNLDNNI